MPKIKKRVNRTVRVSRIAQVKVQRSKFKHFPKIADILVKISLFFLILNSILLIFLRDSIIEALNKANIEATISSIALLGLLWLMIAFFAWAINRSIKEKLSRVSMWELFILSIVTFFSGRMESGVLMFIASIIYLVKTKKK